MIHLTTPEFWECYHSLPSAIQDLADAKFELLKANSRHPSLHFKKVGLAWSARVNREYRALADEEDGEWTWFWIGPHGEYERRIHN